MKITITIKSESLKAEAAVVRLLTKKLIKGRAFPSFCKIALRGATKPAKKSPKRAGQ